MPTPYLSATKTVFTEPVNIQASKDATSTTITWNEPLSTPGPVKLWCLHLTWATGKASTHVRTSEQTGTETSRTHQLTLPETRDLETIIIAAFTAEEYGPAATQHIPASPEPTSTDNNLLVAA